MKKTEFCIKRYLKNQYANIINNFNVNDLRQNSEIRVENYKVWVFWWQGEENMPEIIKICYKRLLEYANGNHVILVTEKNYETYVNIPEYIIKKVNKNIISLTHFSDILRVCLLYEHGGLWLDATVFITAPLELFSFNFYSLKCKNDLWENINHKRWLSFILYSSCHNILPEFVRSIFFEYFRFHKTMMDYYLFDYIIDIGYDTIPGITKLIDNIPPSDAIPHFIHNNFNNKFDITEYNKICDTTHFHKLNWKINCCKYTKNNELTYYGYILQSGVK